MKLLKRREESFDVDDGAVDSVEDQYGKAGPEEKGFPQQ